MAQILPAMWETWVQSLGQEDTLEKEMATHSSSLAWKIPWTEEPGGLQSMGSQSQTRLSDFTKLGGDNEDNYLLQKIPGRCCYSLCLQPCSRPPPTHGFAGDS